MSRQLRERTLPWSCLQLGQRRPTDVVLVNHVPCSGRRCSWLRVTHAPLSNPKKLTGSPTQTCRIISWVYHWCPIRDKQTFAPIFQGKVTHTKMTIQYYACKDWQLRPSLKPSILCSCDLKNLFLNTHRIVYINYFTTYFLGHFPGLQPYLSLKWLASETWS